VLSLTAVVIAAAAGAVVAAAPAVRRRRWRISEPDELSRSKNRISKVVADAPIEKWPAGAHMMQPDPILKERGEWSGTVAPRWRPLVVAAEPV
jgi:hypothetical protein